jgi:uncharacterized membrane protein YbhN (UPF0104 family)
VAEVRRKNEAGRQPRAWARRLLLVSYYALFGLVLLAVGRFLATNAEALKTASMVPPQWWLVPSGIYLGTLVVKGASFDLLARVLGVHVPLRDSIALTATGLLANYALPGNAAIPLRSLYLHRVLGLSYKRYIPVALAAFVFSTGLYGVAAGAAALAIEPVASRSYIAVMLMFGGGGLALMLLLLVPYGRLRFLGERIEAALEGWRDLVSSPRVFRRWLLLEAARALLEIAFFFAIAKALDIPIGILHATILVLAKECSIFLRLTPGGFGIAEGVQAFFAVAFGLDVALVVLAGLIGRSIELILILIISGAMAKTLHARIAAGATATL